MASTILAPFAVGSIFGSALLVSGVASPATIVRQFALDDYHMLVTFLTASSLSALTVYLSNATGYARLAPRSCAEYGVPLGPLGKGLGRYAGNVVGGVMQGVAMAVAGACPGTVLVQVAMGWGRGVWVMLGGVMGGLLFLGLSERMKVKKTSSSGGVESREIKTFQEKLGLTTEQMVVVYEVMMAGVITSASVFAPMDTPWRHAVMGGAMIGVAQASSVLFSKKTLGVSTAYQDVAGHLMSVVGSSRNRPGSGSIIFASGVVAGAKLVGSYMPEAMHHVQMMDISTRAAVAGGVLSIFGARLAGGCTSGHGISGCSTLSISSIITVMSMFGGGIAFKMIVGR